MILKAVRIFCCFLGYLAAKQRRTSNCSVQSKDGGRNYRKSSSHIINNTTNLPFSQAIFDMKNKRIAKKAYFQFIST
ncbi:hypothetical protein Leryth_026063 [Lithospermum erythrorhizon]|nr:hypothetical protein Leryth_026063 [Lithospermum erythrorhizon]